MTATVLPPLGEGSPVGAIVIDQDGVEWRIVRAITDERGRRSADARRVDDDTLAPLVFYPGSGPNGRWVTYAHHMNHGGRL